MAAPIKHYDKWRIRWTDETGNRRSEVYDDYRTACRMLSKRENEVQDIREGLRKRLVENKTVGDLCDYWLANKAPGKRSGHHDQSIIRRHLRPAFGRVELRDLGVAHVDAFVTERRALSKKTVANLLTLLISMLNVGVELHWLAVVPKIRKPRIPLFSRSYLYLKTKEEIRKVLHAAKQESDLAFALYATAVFTGMREGELTALRWRAVNFEERLITIDESHLGGTKGDQVYYAPILDDLLPILQDWHSKRRCDLVFPNERDRMYCKSGRIFQEVFHRVLDATDLPKRLVGEKERRYIVFHSLRHTFASHWMMDGGDVFKLQKILGHQSISMTMRYAHLAPAAFAQDRGRLSGCIPSSPPPEPAIRPMQELTGSCSIDGQALPRSS